MKMIAYLDCPSGISGDMCLGALLDAGVPLDYLQTQLGSLGLDDEFTLSAENTVQRGQRATKALVNLVAGLPQPEDASIASPPPHHHGSSQGYGPRPPTSAASPSVTNPTAGSVTSLLPSRNLPTIEQLINQAPLPDRVKVWSLAVFRCLGEAEATVHGIPIDQVHFHEVGATDAIVDIVGTCLGLDYLNIEALICSPLPTGQGRVNTAHGYLPVPAPAVLTMMAMRQVPIYSNGIAGELVTPTGAAIVTTLAQSFGEPPALTLHRVGLGAGSKALPIANILRLWVGAIGTTAAESSRALEAADVADGAPAEQETIAVLETQLDDLVPQAVGYLYDQLFEAGALDVFTQAIGMKKSRPGLLITVICPPQHQASCETVLFAETTTLGIRHQHQSRTVLHRRLRTLKTPYGPVSVKLAYHPVTQRLMNIYPEYEDCASLARRHRVPWRMIHQAALAAWAQQEG